MNYNANTKNMGAVLTALTSILSEILTGELKEKVATKAIAVLQSEDAQEKITTVLNENMPTKTVTKTRTSTKKVKKDPLAPKKNRSSYIFFCLDKRSSVKNG